MFHFDNALNLTPDGYLPVYYKKVNNTLKFRARSYQLSYLIYNRQREISGQFQRRCVAAHNRIYHLNIEICIV